MPRPRPRRQAGPKDWAQQRIERRPDAATNSKKAHPVVRLFFVLSQVRGPDYSGEPLSLPLDAATAIATSSMIGISRPGLLDELCSITTGSASTAGAE